MKRRIALSAALALLTACGVSAQISTQPPAPASAQTPAKCPAKADPWAGIRFLLGSWEAKATGGVAQAQVSAGYAFRLELRDHVLARHSRSGSCSAPDDESVTSQVKGRSEFANEREHPVEYRQGTKRNCHNSSRGRSN